MKSVACSFHLRSGGTTWTRSMTSYVAGSARQRGALYFAGKTPHFRARDSVIQKQFVSFSFGCSVATQRTALRWQRILNAQGTELVLRFLTGLWRSLGFTAPAEKNQRMASSFN